MGSIKKDILNFILCFILSLVFIRSLFAQEFSLTLSVFDSGSSEPLYGVTVLLDPCNCGGITNTSGIFSKRLETNSYKLSVEYLGYKKENLTVSLNKNINLNLFMQIEEEQLSEIVLLAKKRNQNVESPQMLSLIHI